MENREEILKKHYWNMCQTDVNKVVIANESPFIYNAMQEYSDQQNKAQLEEIERLKSELKDCTENYNHYVDKCFKLESELKAKELISVEDVDNIQELKSQIALLEIQLKDSKQDVEILKFELKAADSVNEKLQRELEIFKN